MYFISIPELLDNSDKFLSISIDLYTIKLPHSIYPTIFSSNTIGISKLETPYSQWYTFSKLSLFMLLTSFLVHCFIFLQISQNLFSFLVSNISLYFKSYTDILSFNILDI